MRSERRKDGRDRTEYYKQYYQDNPTYSLKYVKRTAKEASVGDMVRRAWSKKRILQEIVKCEVLCANYHRILHWEERNVREERDRG